MPGRDLAHLERFWNCRLTTIGRKSGKPRTVTIWFALGPGTVYLTGSKTTPQWCRNLRANGDVRVEIGDESFEGQARIVVDEDEARSVRKRFVDRYWLARLSRPFGGYTDSVPIVIEIA